MLVSHNDSHTKRFQEGGANLSVRRPDVSSSAVFHCHPVVTLGAAVESANLRSCRSGSLRVRACRLVILSTVG